jgi:CRP-like cAMP-binding protein
MAGQLINYLKEKIELSKADEEKIISVATTKLLRRKQYLLQEGDIWKYYAFVSRGLLFRYSVDDKGVPHISQFVPENHWTGDIYSLLYKVPSIFNIEAIENSEIILIKYEDFQNLCAEISKLNDLVFSLLQRSFAVAQNRINTDISNTAEQRYYEFIEKNAFIVARIPQHMIASYLGISPETLTRIRKK